MLVKSRAYLTRPATNRSTIYKNTYFNVYGYLAPLHSGYTRLYFYRYDASKKKYVYYTSHWAANSKYSAGYAKYTKNYIKLPYAGYWYVRAYHGDWNHAPTWSPAKFIYVKR